jgi:hypothetical protein
VPLQKSTRLTTSFSYKDPLQNNTRKEEATNKTSASHQAHPFAGVRSTCFSKVGKAVTYHSLASVPNQFACIPKPLAARSNERFLVILVVRRSSIHFGQQWEDWHKKSLGETRFICTLATLQHGCIFIFMINWVVTCKRRPVGIAPSWRIFDDWRCVDFLKPNGVD